MNLYTDPWITAFDGMSEVEVGLSQLIEDGDRYNLNGITPLTRVAIIRLLQAIKVAPVHEANYFELSRFLQVGGLPDSSARNPISIVTMTDGNSVAFSPVSRKLPTEKDFALGLVTAYFCDRGGLKARVPELGISAQTPAHIGRNIKMRRGKTIAELLDLNPVNREGEYKTPWELGELVFPKYDKPRDQLELVLWPWRRLQIFPNGITIAPGATIDKGVEDPWCDGKSKISELTKLPDPDFEVTRFVLNQALPVACQLI